MFPQHLIVALKLELFAGKTSGRKVLPSYKNTPSVGNFVQLVINWLKSIKTQIINNHQNICR